MQVKAAQGLARILKSEGVPWVACYPTNHVNNALGEEDVPILMMREERYAVAVADAFSRVTGGKQVGVCTIMGGLNAAGIQLAYGAVAQAFEDSSPVLVITAGVPQGSGGHTHYDMVRGFQVGDEMGRDRGQGRTHARFCAPGVHPTALGPSRSGAAHRSPEPRRVRRGRSTPTHQ